MNFFPQGFCKLELFPYVWRIRAQSRPSLRFNSSLVHKTIFETVLVLDYFFPGSVDVPKRQNNIGTLCYAMLLQVVSPSHHYL